MENRDGEIHVETDDARGATNNNVVRWILAISLFGAIVLLSIVWIAGAATQGDDENEVSVNSMAADPPGADTEATDSIVGENAGELDAAEPGDDAAVPTVENEVEEPAPDAEPAAD